MTDVAPSPDTITVAMRFDRRDIPNLRAAADRAKVKDLRADVSTFELAADAAQRDEPLLFICDSLNEARAIAAGYTLHGCRAPTFESRVG